MKTMRKCLLVLLVLAYAGQSVASVLVSCPSMAMDMQGHSMAVGEMGGMDMAAHAGHDMGAQAAVDGTNQSCCDGGLCVMGHCHAAPALLQVMLFVAGAETASADSRLVLSSPLHRSDSLFRPPISS
jgi:hypothetical protein